MTLRDFWVIWPSGLEVSMPVPPASDSQNAISQYPAHAYLEVHQPKLSTVEYAYVGGNAPGSEQSDQCAKTARFLRNIVAWALPPRALAV
jgi:hypothetical protein